MRGVTREALADRFGRFDVVVEVGVGERPDVAEALADRCEVRATDVVDRTVGAGVTFVIDDVTDPDPRIYADADVIYGLNLPPELHRPTRDLAVRSGAVFAFTTLGGDPPVVPARPETVPGETLFWAAGPAGPKGQR